MTARIWLHGLKQTSPLYTSAVLQHLVRHFGVPLARSPDEADAVWVSATDTDALPVVKAARKLAGTRPLVLGGYEAIFGEPWLAWADYVVVGEGADFIEEWSRDWKSAVEMPCVLTLARRAAANYNVRYDLMPLARSGRRKALYLGGRGCKGKCAFCSTGWAMPYSINASSAVRGAIGEAQKRGWSLSLISNDSPFAAIAGRTNTESVRARDYLAHPEFHLSKILRFGIEGWRELDRIRIGKPVSDAQIVSLEQQTACHKQASEWFFIADYPGWSWADVEWFAESVLPLSLGGPRIILSVTYFDPVPHTPWSRECVTGGYCDSQELFALLNGRNKRIVTSPPRSRADAAWRTCFHRASPFEVIKLGPRPNTKNAPEAFPRFADQLSRRGLDHLLSRQAEEPCQRIKVSHRSTETMVFQPILSGPKGVLPGVIGYERLD